MKIWKFLGPLAIAVVLVAAIITAAYYIGLFPTNSGVTLPEMSLNGATVDSDFSIKASFGVVEELRWISTYSVLIGVNESTVAPVQFDDGGKAIVKDLDDSTNSTGSTLAGVEFLVQFFDNDGDGLVSEGDHLLVTCSEPLRHNTQYGVTIIPSFGVRSSASCRT